MGRVTVLVDRMTHTGDALTQLDKLHAQGYAIVDIASSARMIKISLEKRRTRKTVWLNRQDARRMLKGGSTGPHPLLA